MDTYMKKIKKKNYTLLTADKKKWVRHFLNVAQCGIATFF